MEKDTTLPTVGRDIFLPYVSRYMGHKGIESTEYYMRLTESRHDEIRRSGVFGEEVGL